MKVYLVSFVGMKVDNDSSILSKVLKRRGIDCEIVSWDDPSVDWKEPDLCISKSTSNYAGKKEAFIEWMKKVEETTPLWNSARLMEWNLDKHYLKDLQKKGVPLPPTIFVEKGSKEPLSNILRSVNFEDIVIKPTIGAGSFGLQRFKPGVEAENHLRQLTNEGFTVEFLGDFYSSPPQSAIIQPFIPEIVNGEVSLLYFGGKFSHAVLKVAKAGDIRSHPIWGASVEKHKPTSEELKVGEIVIDSIDRTHYARIDMVNTSKGPVIIEVELIEPFLFFDMFPETADVFADYIRESLR